MRRGRVVLTVSRCSGTHRPPRWILMMSIWGPCGGGTATSRIVWLWMEALIAYRSAVTRVFLHVGVGCRVRQASFVRANIVG